MSVTGNPKDPIPHGLKGARKPWLCKCSICRTALRRYNREKRAEYAEAKRDDELAAKREQRASKGPPISTKGTRAAGVRRRTVTNGTVREMEKAVIEECSQITDAKPTLVVAAKNLGRSVDDLTGNPKAIALYNSTMKQLMATMAELRGDKAKAGVTGRKKSGGRLATVGALTKVKRA